MTTSAFNPEQFLNSSYNSAFDTRLPVIPAGEYPAQITKLKLRSGETKEGEPMNMLDVTWEILDEGVKRATEMDHPSARQTLFLELTPEGHLDGGKAKNVSLGRLREAVHQNNPNRPWSPSMLTGAMAKVLVTNDPDGKTGEIYSNIKKVAPV